MPICFFDEAIVSFKTVWLSIQENSIEILQSVSFMAWEMNENYEEDSVENYKRN